MGYSDKDKILIKNLNDSKGYWEYSGKKLMSFLKNAGPKWTVMQRRVYQTQIHSEMAAVSNSRFLTRLLTSGEENFEHVRAKGGHYEYNL